MDTFIDSLLDRMLATSVQTALLTAVVWLLCRNVSRLSPSSQCWLWWLVALQAILGLVANPVELPWLPQAPATAPAVLAATQPNPVDPSAVAPALAVRDWISWRLTVFLLWAAGSIIMAWLTLLEWRRGNAFLRSSSACNDEHLLQALERTAATCGLRAAPELRLSPGIESPLLIGHVRPTLLLPASTSLSDEELDMALIHELTHLRRNDLWWGFIPALARHLFFFHPFAHVAVREYGIAREAACDAAVVHSDHHCRQNYGRLLVRLGASSESRTGLAVTSSTFHALKQRLAMLQKTAFLSRTASIVVVAIVTAFVIPLRLVVAAGAPATANAPSTPQTGPRGGLREVQVFLDSQVGEYARLMQEWETRLAYFKRNNANAGQVTNQDPRLEQEYKQLNSEYEVAKRQYEALMERSNRVRVSADAAQVSESKPAAAKVIANQQTPVPLQRTELAQRQAELDALFKNLSAQKEALSRQQADVAQRLARLNSELSRLGSNSSPQDSESELALARERLTNLRLRYTDTHPEIRQQLARLAELENSTAGSRQQTGPAAPTPEIVPDDYKLAAGNVLQVSVFQNPDLGATLPVRPDGKISTPLVENLVAAGKTPSQLAREIESALSKFIRAPKVSVIVQSAAYRQP